MAEKQNTRTRPLEVLHLALPKTGSVSMKQAYEILGLPTYHGFEWVDLPQDQITIMKAVEAKWCGKGKPFGRKEFDGFLGEWAVLSDVPILAFTDELLEAYPEAKVVLVERDIDRWYASFDKGVIESFTTWRTWLMRNYLENFTQAKPATAMETTLFFMFKCTDVESFRARAKPTYREHYAKVRAAVPKERLLEYELGSGWEPLCEFLGKDVPNVPFPHVNETVVFRARVSELMTRELKKGLLALTKLVALPAVMLTVAWVLYKR